MSRYRKISVRMWGDEKFLHLSPPKPCGRYLWIYLLTNAETVNIPGLYRAGEAQLAEALEWPLEGFRKAFTEASSEGLVKADWKARVVYIPRGINYNQPESPNVVRSWRHPWDEIPECHLKNLSYQSLKAFLEALGEGFVKAFGEACLQPEGMTSEHPSANQEQEQEQEREQEQEKKDSGEPPAAPPAPAPPPDPAVLSFPIVGPANKPKEWNLLESKLREYRETFLGVDVLAQCKLARQWCIDNAQKRKTAGGMPAFLTRWLSKEQNKGRPATPAISAARATMTQSTQRVIRAFQIAKGNKDDAGWDTLMLDKSIQPANQLIAYFGGDWQTAVRCIEEVRDAMAEQFPNWGWDAVIKRAPGFGRGEAA